jgi:hypothetical protein
MFIILNYLSDNITKVTEPKDIWGISMNARIDNSINRFVWKEQFGITCIRNFGLNSTASR